MKTSLGEDMAFHAWHVYTFPYITARLQELGRRDKMVQLWMASAHVLWRGRMR